MILPYYSNIHVSLYKGDCNQLVSQVSKSVDVVFADPPYFLSNGFKTQTRNGDWRLFDKGDWDHEKSKEEIHEFNAKWISACRSVLKPNGTIWVSGTYHNIFDVAQCLSEQGFKILNLIVWQKSDPPITYSAFRFNFTAEYIIWARKTEKDKHLFNYNLMMELNGGKQMPDVWRLPAVANWEKKCGHHTTQKPLSLLNRIILASTNEGDTILDPFAGSCTTGIAANLLGRNFIGIDMDEKYLALGQRRFEEIQDPTTAKKMLDKMQENPEEVTVMVNHASKEKIGLMIEKGICYMRAGDSKGSLLVEPGFERMQYVCLHTNGEEVKLFKLKKKGCFQIWTMETLKALGFHPEHAPYYVVLHFDNTKEIPYKKIPQLRQRINTYRAKIRPLSDFIGIK